MNISKRNAFVAVLCTSLPLNSALAQSGHEHHESAQAIAPASAGHAASDRVTQQPVSDHSGMDHEAMMQTHQRQMNSSMQRGDGSPASRPETDDSGADQPQMNHSPAGDTHLNHGSMGGEAMGHGNAGHSAAHPSKHSACAPISGIAPGEASRPPVPTLTPEDRVAAFPDLPEHGMHRGGVHYLFLADEFEWQEDADAGSTLAWDLSGWVGGDVDRLAFRSEGGRSNGRTEDAELQLLWSHAIGPWWETVAGLRQDFAPGSTQTWTAFGVQGMPLYGLETEATAYIGEGGQSALRLEAEYDVLLTQRLVLQPKAELNVYGRSDEQRGVGSGLADASLGLRLRYELSRQFAPYLGVDWNRGYGRTAEMRRDEGERVNEARLVAGIRFWF